MKIAGVISLEHRIDRVVQTEDREEIKEKVVGVAKRYGGDDSSVTLSGQFRSDSGTSRSRCHRVVARVQCKITLCTSRESMLYIIHGPIIICITNSYDPRYTRINICSELSPLLSDLHHKSAKILWI